MKEKRLKKWTDAINDCIVVALAGKKNKQKTISIIITQDERYSTTQKQEEMVQ